MGRVVACVGRGRGDRAGRSAHDRSAQARRRRGLRCGRLAQSGGARRGRPRLSGGGARASSWSCASATAQSTRTASARGDLVWRTHDPEIDKAARPLSEPAAPGAQAAGARAGRSARRRSRCVTEWSVGAVSVTVRVGRCRSGRRGIARSTRSSARAVRPPGQHAVRIGGRGAGDRRRRLRSQFAAEPDAPRAPWSSCRSGRRSSVGLPACCSRSQARTVSPPAPWTGQEACPTLHLLVRTPSNSTPPRLRPASITLDYLDLYGLRPSVERVRAAGIAVRVASPRVLKPGEERIVDFLLGCDCPILVRSAGLLQRSARARASGADRRFQPERGQRAHRGGAARTRAWRSSRRRTI